MGVEATDASGGGGRPGQGDVRRAGERLIEALPSRRSPRRLIEDRVMERIAEDPELKAALFRLVDVAPACRSWRDLGLHLGVLLEPAEHPPRPIGAVRRMAGSRYGRGLVGMGSALAVRMLAGRFIAGSDVAEARRGLRRLWGRGVASSVDLLGEATVTEAEADAYARRCLRALEELAAETARWPPRRRLDLDRFGPVPRANLSVKVSALTPDARPEAPGRGIAGAEDRLRTLLRAAREAGAHLHVDMESLDLRETVVELVFELLEQPEFREGPAVGIVLQAYLRDSPEQLERWLGRIGASGRRVPFGIRLVKGAYWDHEVVEARQSGWRVPVFESRSDCDRNFERLTRRLTGAPEAVRVAIASHNLRSIAHAAVAAEHAGIGSEVEFQVLRGLGDDVMQALAGCGLRVRTYEPVGDLIGGMAYLVRRLLENSSNDSFLRARTRADDLADLLVAP